MYLVITYINVIWFTLGTKPVSIFLLFAYTDRCKIWAHTHLIENRSKKVPKFHQCFTDARASILLTQKSTHWNPRASVR